MTLTCSLGLPVKPYVGAGIARIYVKSDDAANVTIANDDSTEFAWNVMARRRQALALVGRAGRLVPRVATPR